MKALLILLLAIVALRSAASAQTPPPVVRFDPVPISVSGTMPRDWRLLRPPQEKKPPTTRDELYAVLRERFAADVFFVVTPSATPSMDPCLTVRVKLSDGQTPRAQLTEALHRGSQRPAQDKFRVTQPLKDTTIFGVPAVMAEYSYSYFLRSHEYTMVHRTWFIQQEELLFLVSLVLRADEVKDLAADVEAILRTIQLTP